MATESYFEKSLSFKIRKVLRYLELYGVSRTLVKVKGQMHMRAQEGFDTDVWENQGCKTRGSAGKTMGLIGCGSYTYGVIAYYLAKHDKSFLKGAMDTDSTRARSIVKRYDGAYATIDPSVILDDPDIDLVYIASNHASHADYAIEALKRGKSVHIEKPHVVTQAQLDSLIQAMQAQPDLNVFLGFNRPRSVHFTRLRKLLDREAGPLMINWFVAGHAIDDDHWYFKPEEGGRILGNLCHWSDLTLEMIAPEFRLPCRIVPTSPKGTKSDFVTALEFADGSLASITFSAKGHTFEGVREILNVHKGDLLAEIKDFKSLTYARDYTRKKRKSRFRDHGHQANILNSLNVVRGNAAGSKTKPDHIITTARLFLAIREAHETGETITLNDGPAT